MALLANREHSHAELARKLIARGFDAAAVDETLAHLAKTGLLDEARLAEVYVAERLHKGFGPLRIRQELRGKGLTGNLIAPHLRLDNGEWLSLIAAAHDKRFGPAASGDAKERARRGRFLEYRGFPTDLIARFLHGARGD